jgi:hypothetical protein
MLDGSVQGGTPEGSDGALGVAESTLGQHRDGLAIWGCEWFGRAQALEAAEHGDH